MGIKFPSWSGLLVLLATIAFISPAQAESEPSNYETTSNAFVKAYFHNDPNFYENGRLKRQVEALIGYPSPYGSSFTENEIAKDAQLINILYQDVLAQQSTNDPYLRTPDLPNPYKSSLLMTPGYNLAPR